ncbi:MAG: Toxin HigB-1 [Syntrophorhabdus sp. PtaU1.Bin153]|nr:MAG: Toxin HigB-1 [Syntrophorhabdus sp. PtaU1.Bin153]
MRFRFSDKKLETLYRTGEGSEGYPNGIAGIFVRRVRVIEGAIGENDLRAMKSLHFEKLKGQRNRHSIRLNKQWRLILTFEKDREGKIVVIIEINNHYED